MQSKTARRLPHHDLGHEAYPAKFLSTQVENPILLFSPLGTRACDMQTSDLNSSTPRKRQSTTSDGALARNSQCENDTLLLVSPPPKCAHLTRQSLGTCQCNKGFKALDAQRYMPLLKLRSWSLKLGLRGKLPIGEPWVILFLPLKLRRESVTEYVCTGPLIMVFRRSSARRPSQSRLRTN